MLVRVTVIALGVSLLVACPGERKSDTPPATCSKDGDSCTFAPGKLGFCITVDGPDGKPTLTCQSQH